MGFIRFSVYFFKKIKLQFITGVEISIINIAKNIASSLLKWGLKGITKNNCSDYSKELAKVISSTINLYDKKYSIEETDKIPFYKSQVLLSEFLKFRFTRKLDKQNVKQLLEADNRIIAPTQRQINNFFEIFDEQVNSSFTLKSLNIEVNFKEEVFNISDFLKSFHDDVTQSIKEIRKEISGSNVSTFLIEEWNAQLDEIFEEIKSFKAFTAKERLDKLEQRIIEQSINNDKLFARLYYLQSECLDQIALADKTLEQDKLIIRMYKLQPNNIEFKAKAALAYYDLNELDTAASLTNEILTFDEFNILAWVTKCYLAKDKYKETLQNVPAIVKSKNLFKINLFYWLMNHRFIKNIEDINVMKLNLEIDYNLPPVFSYRNMKYQHLVATYLLGKFYNENPSMVSELFDEVAANNLEFKYAYQILKLSTRNLINTEIEKSYYYYQFQYYCCSYIINQDKEDITFLENIFKKMELRSLDVYIRMMQAYNSIQSKEAYLKAIKVGESYKGDFNDALYLFLASNYGFIDENEQQTKAFIKYIKQKPRIDKLFFLNFISFLRFNKTLITEELKATIENTFLEKPCDKEEYIYLLKVFCYINFKIGNSSPEEINEFIEKSRHIVSVNEKEISIHIAYAYCYIQQEEKAKQYLKENLQINYPSESLKLYCKVLFNCEGDKVELLGILENWRKNWKPDFELLQIEFELRRLQSKWSEATKVCRKAIEYFPDSEFFINSLFISLNNDMQFEEIRNYYVVVKNKIFKEEYIAVNVSKALLRAGLCKESLELLYNHAKEKKNEQSRREYAVLFIRYPEELFKQFEIVEIDSYVKYEINGLENITHITESNKGENSNHLFLNKKVGDSFSIPQKYSDVFARIKVVQIFNKYGALLHELFKEAENPLSGHLIQSFKFKDDSVEGMEETFIENFGVRGSLQKEKSESLFKNYYDGNISFGEITNAVFGGDFIDAYFILSNQNGKPFKAISPVISGVIHSTIDTKYVLDFTSLCLFYQLSKESNISFSQKFYISHLIREKIVEGLEDAKLNPQSNFSISITTEKVIPHFYDEGFYSKRINTFQTLLDWVDSNCILLDVPERLNLIAGSKSKLKNLDLFMNILIDCRLIVDKEDYILLTNNVFYYRQLKGGVNNIVSPLHFLEKYHIEETESYLNFMLKHNYVGIPITASLLNEQFYKMLSGAEDNRFSICLENLRYAWNPDYKHITESIKFIKGLYVNSLIDNKLREQTTFAVFQNLVVGMDARLIKVIIHLVKTEFSLLEIQMINIIQLLTLTIGNR